MTELIPNADRDAFHKQFEEAPGDLTAYGAMGDLMDELGYPTLAHAYRWMGRRGVFPHRRTHYVGDSHQRKVPKSFRWAWYSGRVMLTERSEVPNVLPGSRLKWHSLPALVMSGDQRVYPSHAAAVMDLAKWLARLKEAYDIEPPKKGL